jgi:16S rRNA G1207 methylase RsmC
VVGQEVDAELALLNPPCHAGTSLDLTAARRLFGVIQARRLLVVANRQLAYEADLQRLGDVVRIAEDSRFKVLSVTRF